LGQLQPVDMAATLWRERALVASIGAGVGLAALGVAIVQPKTYEARAELLVRLGQEYVFEPRVGAAGAGAVPALDAIVHAETALATSPELARRIVDLIGPTRLYPNVSGEPEQASARATTAFLRDLSVITAPDSPSITLQFEARDPALAAETLNRHIDAYLAFRRDVLVNSQAGALQAQSDSFQARLEVVSIALANLLETQDVGDFDRDLAALGDLVSQSETDLFAARALRQEADARVAALRASLAEEPEEIELYAESDAEGQLTALYLEREQLLARYQADAPPVRAIDRRIEQVRSFLQDNPAPGLVRRGPNPVRQEIAGRLAEVTAEARAARGREAALQAQLTESRERLRQLQALEPRYRALVRERAVLEENAAAFAGRAAEAEAFREIAGEASENISVIERATPPTRGSSMRLPIAVAGLLIASVLAIGAGLARGMTRRPFVTAGAAGRAIDLPVLAVLTGDLSQPPTFAPEAAASKPRDAEQAA
jgi:uncharacterized protein involved in exopolysaccharide biosynthesis